MTCPHEQTLNHFGIDGQIEKLEEELEELLVEIRRGKSLYPSGIKEMADVMNVIRSIDIATNGAVTQAANTKMLRTQIRMKSGFYDTEQIQKQGENDDS